MKDRDLDRIIDAAAEQMMSREPSDALAKAVMARVRAYPAEGERRRTGSEDPPRRLVWATVSVAATACAVIAVVLLTQAPEPISQNPGRSSSIQLTAEPHVSAAQPDAVIENFELRRRRVEGVTRAASQVRVEGADLKVGTTSIASANAGLQAGPLDPIPFESIAPHPIDFASIAIEAAVVDQIVIDPIIIEPLSASND